MNTQNTHFNDDAALEHARLWNDINRLFADEAYTMGVMMPDLDVQKPLSPRFMLESVPANEQKMSLCVTPMRDKLIGGVTLSVVEADTNNTRYWYVMTPRSIVYQRRNISRKDVGKTEIELLRADLADATWSADTSRAAAEIASSTYN